MKSIPSTDFVFDCCACNLLKEVPIHGKIYVTQNRVVFYSSIMKILKVVCFPSSIFVTANSSLLSSRPLFTSLRSLPLRPTRRKVFSKRTWKFKLRVERLFFLFFSFLLFLSCLLVFLSHKNSLLGVHSMCFRSESHAILMFAKSLSRFGCGTRTKRRNSRSPLAKCRSFTTLSTKPTLRTRRRKTAVLEVKMMGWFLSLSSYSCHFRNTDFFLSCLVNFRDSEKDLASPLGNVSLPNGPPPPLLSSSILSSFSFSFSFYLNLSFSRNHICSRRFRVPHC